MKREGKRKRGYFARLQKFLHAPMLTDVSDKTNKKLSCRRETA